MFADRPELRRLRISDGAVNPPVSDPASPNGWAKVVLFVHGFNVDDFHADASYSAMLRNLERTLAEEGKTDPDLNVRIWHCYWPGYFQSVWSRVFGHRAEQKKGSLLSGPSYAVFVGRAIQSGKGLGRYIGQLRDGVGNPTQVVVVAHSLGCRLTLEALDWLRDEPQPEARVPGICLMAAAVPTHMVEEFGTRRAAALLAQRSSVLYSGRDSILFGFFPAGQTLAGDGEGDFPEAVGRHGRPQPFWTLTEDTGLEHGDYWSAGIAARAIARLLGYAIGPEPPVAHLPEWPDMPENAIHDHELPSV